MNVHLIKSNNLSEELYLQVAELLKSVNGPIQFHCAPKYEVYFNYEELVPKEIEDKNMFEKKGVPSPMSFNKAFMREERSFPLERREASWDLLFKECHTYRRLYRIKENDFVFLLTDVANDMNWFASLEFSNPYNGFIHAADWDYYIQCPECFPIAYEIIALVLQKNIFNNVSDIRTAAHNRPIGCVSDLCMNKTEIVLKLRTADICEGCLELIGNKMTILEINQCMQIMNLLRERMLFVTNRKNYLKASRLKIDGKKIILPDYSELELRLRPLEIIVYRLFLNHPEGIFMHDLGDHRNELFEHYAEISGSESLDSMHTRVNDLTNVFSESASQKISRIKKVFEDSIGKELSQRYIIKGPNGAPKKIELDRSLVLN
jgi:hypothetical protein